MRIIISIALIASIHFLQAQNVGVGTNSPASDLHVMSNSYPQVRIETTSAFGSSLLNLKTPLSINDNFRIIKNGGSASGTQSGISLSNLTQLINGTDAGGLMFGNVSNNPIYFLTSNIERMRILGNGNIGINVTTPSYPLHVYGEGSQTIYAENRSLTQGNGVIGLSLGPDGGGIAGAAGTVGEIISGYEPGQFALIGTTGAATGVGSFTLSGTAVRAKSVSGLALNTTGNIRMTSIGEGAGKVLTSDASGNATWQTFNQNPHVGFSAITLANQGIPTSTFTFLNNFGEAFDNGNNFDAATGTFTAPSAGIYHFNATVYWAQPLANTMIWTQVYLNGGSVPGAMSSTFLPAGTGTFTSEHSVNLTLSQGTTVQLRVYQTSGNTLQALGGTNPLTTIFGGYKIY
jgi:hypothetical protein